MRSFQRFRLPLATSAAACALLLAIIQPADASVGVTINGNAVDVSPAPITQAGRVFVPLRGVFEQLGASVVYDAGQINATGNGRNISLHIGSTRATVDGQAQALDVAPFIIGASTYVPLRFISEALGASVNWDDADSVVQISMNGAPQAQPQQDDVMAGEGDVADVAPPPIPDYEQPPVPAPNEIWQPGYWAWSSNGYFWVPGTWVDAPQPGYLWTPGYWQVSDRGFTWNAGYWATSIGFYGGVNYGGGYYGNGYAGGRWSNNEFRYNTYVTHVDVNVVHNVYVDRSVNVRNEGPRVSYNGGPNGVQARPTADDQSVAHSRHLGMTPVQQQHVQTAAHDPRLFAAANHNQPPVLAVARPLSATNRPAGSAAVAPADGAAPADRAAPDYHAAPAAPAYHAPAQPAERAAPADRAAPLAAPADRAAPADHPAERVEPQAEPAYHAPAARPAPAYHAPVPAAAPEHPAPVRAAPAYHAPAPAAPPVRAAPVYHAPVAAPVRAAPADRAPAPAAAPAANHAPPARPAPAERQREPKPEETKQP